MGINMERKACGESCWKHRRVNSRLFSQLHNLHSKSTSISNKFCVLIDAVPANQSLWAKTHCQSHSLYSGVSLYRHTEKVEHFLGAQALGLYPWRLNSLTCRGDSPWTHRNSSLAFWDTFRISLADKCNSNRFLALAPLVGLKFQQVVIYIDEMVQSKLLLPLKEVFTCLEEEDSSGLEIFPIAGLWISFPSTAGTWNLPAASHHTLLGEEKIFRMNVSKSLIQRTEGQSLK